MNAEKLKQLQNQVKDIRIGGKVSGHGNLDADYLVAFKY